MANLRIVGCCVSFCGALPVMDVLWYAKMKSHMGYLCADPVLVFACEST